VALGRAIKIVGAILGALIAISSLSSAGGSSGSGLLALSGIVFGVVVGVLFWVCGVVVAAQGQILLATLDNAVASSHFLTDPERADAMGLPRGVAERNAS
jgi:hypothetical protein